ncbi:MAG: hypothetical protein ABIP38_02505 [Steroidobacteraceae bacterium]
MNQGKRYVRNTVIGLYGTAVLFVGLNRLYASTLDTQVPQWLRSTMTLGLAVHPEHEPVQAMKAGDLAELRNFRHVRVVGNISVEIVGAEAYRVTFTPASGSKAEIQARQEDDLLSLYAGGEGGGTGVLRIELPTLVRLSAQDVSELTVRGLQAQDVSVSLHNVAAARLQQNKVAHWKLYSSEALEVPVDATTLASGSLQTQGDLSIRYREEPR